MVEQPLTRARLDPKTAGRMQAGVGLCWACVALAGGVVSEITPLALELGIDLGINQREPASNPAEPTALAILLRNLLENAIRYSPSGARVDVGISREDDAAC